MSIASPRLASPRSLAVPSRRRLRPVGLVLAALLPIAATAGCNQSSTAASDLAVSDGSAAVPDLAVPTADLATPPDLAEAPDLAVAPDLASAPDLSENNLCTMHDPAKGSCQDLVDWINAWLACHSACSNDNDCEQVDAHTGLFCRNICTTVAARGAAGPYLDSLNAAFGNMGCGMAGCACPRPPTPTCHQGYCVGM